MTGGLRVAWLFALGLALTAATEGTRIPVDIELATGTAREKAAEAQLRRLLETFDLEPLLFTTRVRIQSRVIPHSHPVLTLNTRHLEDDERQLATFIHEQMHWYSVETGAAFGAAMTELRRLYPEVPVGGDQGARNEHSSYLHLIICLLEYDGLARYLGPERARQVIARTDVYRWIYDKVLNDEPTIRGVMDRHGLALPG